MYNQYYYPGATSGPCPHCGRCPHCGQGTYYPNFPIQPPVWCGITQAQGTNTATSGTTNINGLTESSPKS